MNKHMKITGTNIDLPLSFDTPFEGYGEHNHPMTDICRANSVKESFQYVNESIYPVCITGSNGMQMEIKGGTRNLNRLVIVREITIGSDVKLNLNRCTQALGSDSDHFVTYVSNVIEREKGNLSKSITMYYVLDTSNLMTEPNGIHLNQIGITVVHKRYSKTVPYVTNRPFTTVDDDGNPETLWGASIQLVHIPESKISIDPTFLMLGNRIIQIEPTQVEGLKPGFHVLTHGSAKVMGSEHLENSIYIKPEDYKTSGLYESGKQLAEGIASKDRASEVISLLKGNSGIFKAEQSKPTISFLDEAKIGNHSLRDCIGALGETLGAFSKMKTDIKNIVK